MTHRYKTFIRDSFRRMVRDAVAAPDLVAEQLALLYDGAVALAATRPEVSPALVARQAAASLLRAAPRPP